MPCCVFYAVLVQLEAMGRVFFAFWVCSVGLGWVFVCVSCCTCAKPDYKQRMSFLWFEHLHFCIWTYLSMLLPCRLIFFASTLAHCKRKISISFGKGSGFRSLQRCETRSCIFKQAQCSIPMCSLLDGRHLSWHSGANGLGQERENLRVTQQADTSDTEHGYEEGSYKQSPAGPISNGATQPFKSSRQTG